MSRKVAQGNQIVKLIVGAGQAAPTPPVGPALGSKGVKSIDFCKEFNAKTSHMIPGTPIPARITVRPDRSFFFEIRTPSTSWMLLKAAGVEPRKNKLKGAEQPGKGAPVGTLSLKHVWEIAKIKRTEKRLSVLSEEAMVKCILGQAKSIGLEIVA